MKKIVSLLSVLVLAACGGINSRTDLDNQKVFFDFDSADVSSDARDNLLEQSAYMKTDSDVNIVVQGHCDERGSSEYNLALGALRAGNATHVLIRDGIAAKRIKTISYGKNKPQFLGSGESVWQKNRNATTRLN